MGSYVLNRVEKQSMTNSTPVGSRLPPSAVAPRWLFLAGVLGVTVVGAVVRWGFLDQVWHEGVMLADRPKRGRGKQAGDQ